MSAPCFAIDLVTFDVGGTLLTYRPDLHRAYAEVLDAAGVPADPARLAAALDAEREPAAARRRESVPHDHRVSAEAGDARRRTYVVNVLRRAGIAPEALERAADAIQAAYNTPQMYRTYDDALPTVRELWNRGLKLGAVANGRPGIGKLLLELGFGEYLGFWVISEQLGYEKPHPAMFERAVAIGGSTPERALHVGDDLMSDVEGAQAAGMQAVWLNRDGRADAADACAPSTLVIHRLDELLATVG